MAHLYDVGTRAWQPDNVEGWIGSEVIEKTVNGENVQLVFRLLDNEEEVSLKKIRFENTKVEQSMLTRYSINRRGRFRPRSMYSSMMLRASCLLS